jgi:hypothetical protein
MERAGRKARNPKMGSGGLQSRFAYALETQMTQAEYSHTGALKCPFGSTTPGHYEHIFQDFQQLYDHVKAKHTSELQGLTYQEARAKVDKMLKLR